MTVCKRIGAWLLTLVLLVSALPYTAFAASEDSHVVNATMEETSVEDIADNVTTQLLRGAKTKDETLSMEAKPTHEDSDSVEIIVVVDDSVAKPTAQAQVQSLLQKQEKAAATMSRAIGEAVEPERQYTTLLNGFSATVTYGQYKALKELDCVESVFLSPTFSLLPDTANSTRMIGGIIMTHGDDDGLILPPAVAPIQVVVVPIAAHKPGVSEKAAELAEKISKYARVKLDDSDNAPGWKFSQWEMKGVPLRLEIGPKDLEKNQCVLVRRDTREKIFVSLDELETAIPAQLEALRKDLYERALANREKRTWAATTMEEVKELAKANTGYIKTMWCGDLACEMKMKEEVGLSSRCMPFEQEHLSDVCPCCGKPAKTMVYWGIAY